MCEFEYFAKYSKFHLEANIEEVISIWTLQMRFALFLSLFSIYE